MLLVQVLQFVLDAVKAEAFNPRTLFLFGTYTIGKERLFLEIAKTLNKKVQSRCLLVLSVVHCRFVQEDTGRKLSRPGAMTQHIDNLDCMISTPHLVLSAEDLPQLT